VGTEQHPSGARPIEVTAVVVLSVIQSAFLMGAGVLVLWASDRADVAASIEIGRSDVVVAGWLLVVVGAVQAALAAGLATGREWVRSIYAVIATLELAPAVYALVALQEVRAGGVVSLVLSVGVLWLLYGSPRSQAYFAT
jgi:hypothetical protein